MAKRTGPTLQHCKQEIQMSEAPVAHLNDRLTSLPDEILLNIWSRLTMKEAARANLVSRMSKPMWLVHPSLNFEDNNGKNGSPRLLSRRKKSFLQEKSTFTDRVDYILTHHQGPIVDEFRIAFDLTHENRSHIDNWLVFAFSKHVKRLELVSAAGRGYWEPYELKMPVEYHVSSSFGTFKSALTSLCLVAVVLTTQVIESFLDSFPSLETLRISYIHTFTSIRASSSLVLKHLEVTYCERLDSIDLVVPQLLSFICEAQPTALHFRNASCLSVVSIGRFHINDRITDAFDCLSIYCAQLEYLELKSNLYQKHNLQIHQCPAFPNVKHLELNIVIPVTSKCSNEYVNAVGVRCMPENYDDVSILGWAPVIMACPVLQKLTLNLEACFPLKGGFPMRKIEKLDAHPLSSLKTLEIVGFLGNCASLELVMFVMENADMLDEMIVEAFYPYRRKGVDYSDARRTPDLESHKVALELLETRPQSVNLIFRDDPGYSS